jgi:hypothetical protein
MRNKNCENKESTLLHLDKVLMINEQEREDIQAKEIQIPIFKAIPRQHQSFRYMIKCSPGDFSPFLISFLPDCLLKLVVEYVERIISICVSYMSSHIALLEEENEGLMLIRTGESFLWSHRHTGNKDEEKGKILLPQEKTPLSYTISNGCCDKITHLKSQIKEPRDLLVMQCMIDIVLNTPVSFWPLGKYWICGDEKIITRLQKFQPKILPKKKKNKKSS